MCHMARRFCPVCKRTVDEEVAREGNVVVKRCHACGHVFAKYEVRKAAAQR